MFLGKFLHEFCLILRFSCFQPQCFYNVYRKGSSKKEKKNGFHNLWTEGTEAYLAKC